MILGFQTIAGRGGRARALEGRLVRRFGDPASGDRREDGGMLLVGEEYP